MELIFEVQQYGQPPSEIIQGIAPGFMFDSANTQNHNMNDGVDDDFNLDNLPLPNPEELTKKLENGECCVM